MSEKRNSKTEQIREARKEIKRLESDPVADVVYSVAIDNVWRIAAWKATLRRLGVES